MVDLDHEMYKSGFFSPPPSVGSMDDEKEKLEYVMWAMRQTHKVLGIYRSSVDNNAGNIQGLADSLSGAVKAWEKVVGVFEKRIAKCEQEITGLKTTMIPKHELEARNNVLAPNDQLASNDQLTEIQRERRVLVINDLDPQAQGEARDDGLAEEASKILRKHNPSLDKDDIKFVKKLKGYKNNNFRMIVELMSKSMKCYPKDFVSAVFTKLL